MSVGWVIHPTPTPARPPKRIEKYVYPGHRHFPHRSLCHVHSYIFRNVADRLTNQLNWKHIFRGILDSATFICVSRHNAQKRRIVFITDCSWKYIYKLSKLYVEKLCFQSDLEMLKRRSFMLRGRAVEGSKRSRLPWRKLICRRFQHGTVITSRCFVWM